MNSNTTVNERIAICRKLANLTQIETAKKLGINVSTYSQMERKGNITVNTVMALAEIFKADPSVIFCGFPERPTIERLPPSPPKPKGEGGPKTKSPTIASSVFPLTNTEENVIRILRKISKEDRKEVMELLKIKDKDRKRRKAYPKKKKDD